MNHFFICIEKYADTMTVTLHLCNIIALSAIPSKKKIKDDGQYIRVTNIDNILDTVMYSDGDV